MWGILLGIGYMVVKNNSVIFYFYVFIVELGDRYRINNYINEFIIIKWYVVFERKWEYIL